MLVVVKAVRCGQSQQHLITYRNAIYDWSLPQNRVKFAVVVHFVCAVLLVLFKIHLVMCLFSMHIKVINLVQCVLPRSLQVSLTQSHVVTGHHHNRSKTKI